MERELILCVPGPWKDRSDFVRAVVSGTNGDFMFAGMILACPKRKDHVTLDFETHMPGLRKAFEIAGQGKISAAILDKIADHRGVVYLHFPITIQSEKERVIPFTDALKSSGGIAIKVESTGIAHEWDRWFSALNSENPFDLYRAFVVLVGDTEHYFSCGMHHFGLPDVEVPRTIDIHEAADLINRFNYWQIVERPTLASGHTFSLTPDAPRYRLTLRNDSRHDSSDLFHNPSGIWNLGREAAR